VATRIADNLIQPAGLPQQCSACAGQESGYRHIDFDAAVDRGFYGDDPATKITMDNLVICEGCIATAARLLDWMPTHEFQGELQDYKHKYLEEKQRADKQEEFSSRLEDVLSHDPKGRTVDHRIKPRPSRKLQEA